MPDFAHEDQHPDDVIIGIDEVGRGPLAGPVVCAGVIIENRGLAFLNDIQDSKTLSAKKRDKLAPLIQQHMRHHIAIIDVETIDRINIFQATMQGMSECAQALKPDRALIDGNKIPGTMPCPAQAIVKGDQHSLSIACASIIAKVARDRMMADLAMQYPGYGWERNAGYGTREHLDALSRMGPTPHHRRSFAPVSRLFGRSRQTA